MRNYMHKALLAAVVLSLLSAVAAAPVAEAGEVEPSQAIPAGEVERMMKLQDVILKAMAGRCCGSKR